MFLLLWFIGFSPSPCHRPAGGWSGSWAWASIKTYCVWPVPLFAIFAVVIIAHGFHGFNRYSPIFMKFIRVNPSNQGDPCAIFSHIGQSAKIVRYFLGHTQYVIHM